MTHFIVHIYREMRLSYAGIEAATPQAAAAIAGGKPTDEADNVEDCEGENLAALVDVAGDEEYLHSVTIDFEHELRRKAAPKLLGELAGISDAWSNAEGGSEVMDYLESHLYAIRAALAEAKAAGVEPEGPDISGPLARREQIAARPPRRNALCKSSPRQRGAGVAMTSPAHTPGPWGQAWQFIVAPDAEGVHPDLYIAEIAEEDGEGRVASSEQRAANGRLIAAAPELLAACRMVVERWEHGDLAEAARLCHAAVALATDGHPPWGASNANAALETPYSVLLLYPDYANDTGHESFYAFVEACDPLDAVAKAQRQAAQAQEGIEIEPGDFTPMLVIEGHHVSEPLFNK